MRAQFSWYVISCASRALTAVCAPIPNATLVDGELVDITASCPWKTTEPTISVLETDNALIHVTSTQVLSVNADSQTTVWKLEDNGDVITTTALNTTSDGG